jgi:asparagine synthase (glutamine-hydrolysing)
MCGIAGIIDLNGMGVESSELEAAASAMAHRGPDGHGVYIDRNVGLAHSRLSIIDIESGSQPMCNEDGTVWVSFNGEIYNFREIRKDLEAKGHVFKTKSDTEAIVHLYEEFGRDCVIKMNGMFAFAVFDSKKNKIILARDRLGEKPIVYFRTKDKIAFASELGALKKVSGFPRGINLQAAHDYFSLLYVPCPDTIYKDVHKLPPAHTLEINTATGELSLQRYWLCDFRKKTEKSDDEIFCEFRSLLEDAVKMRLIADVPLGAFLSGGMDSSVISAIMAKLFDIPLKTFTIGFSESLYDERYHARYVSKILGTCHFEKMVKPDDFTLLEKLLRNFGEPYCDASILPTYMLSKFTREEVTVALSGDGADELFCGYYRYMLMKYANFADFLPLFARKTLAASSSLLPSSRNERTLAGKLKRILSAFAETGEKRYYDIIVRFDEEVKKSVYGERLKDCEFRSTTDYFEGLLERGSSSDPVEKYSELDMNSYLHCDVLSKVDTASMAASLEARSPFLDYRIAEFAAALPLRMKQRGRKRKYLIEKAFRDILPQSVFSREKKGFGVPLADWFRGSWQKIAIEKIIEGAAVKEGYLEKESVERMLNEHVSLRSDCSYAIFAMLVFAIWLENETTNPPA